MRWWQDETGKLDTSLQFILMALMFGLVFPTLSEQDTPKAFTVLLVISLTLLLTIPFCKEFNIHLSGKEHDYFKQFFSNLIVSIVFAFMISLVSINFAMYYSLKYAEPRTVSVKIISTHRSYTRHGTYFSWTIRLPDGRKIEVRHTGRPYKAYTDILSAGNTVSVSIQENALGFRVKYLSF